MNIEQIKDVISPLISAEITRYGYKVNREPEYYEDNIWFEKYVSDIHYVISFQFSGLDTDTLNQVAVNLTRNYFIKEIDGKSLPSKYFLFGRLASYLWIDDKYDLEWNADQWWVFEDEEQLRHLCIDLSNKLVTYGLPWLENLESKPLGSK